MRRRGFTLVEIIVVLVIVAILAAALIPTMSGVIQRADDTKMINETRTLLSSVQYLLSENYVSDIDGGDTQFVVDYAKAVELADVPGELKSVSYRGIMDVTHLLYERGGRYCLYCRDTSAGIDCTGCDNTTAFVVSDDSTRQFKNMVKNSTETVYNAAVTNLSGYFTSVGKTIDSVALANDASNAKKLFDSVPADQQAFLNSVTWKMVRTSEGMRLYFTVENYGAGSSDGAVRVFKYDPAKGYQYNDNHVVQDGKIMLGVGSDSQWYSGGVLHAWGEDLDMPG